MNNLVTIAENRIQECIDIAERHLAQRFDIPTLKMTARGRNAGTANIRAFEINLNKILFIENQQTFINEVIPHEVCHLLAYKLYGRVKPHGVEWQELMRQVYRLQPKVTHQLDISQSQEPHYPYVCHCGTIQLSIRRHNKVMKNIQQYRCIKCNQILTPENLT